MEQTNDLNLRSKEFSLNQIDVSMSDITDSASLDMLHELSPVHLLGALPDGENGDDFTIQDEMRFTLWSTREMAIETDCSNTENRSTVSSLTYDMNIYSSFDELQKRYTETTGTETDLEQAPISKEPENHSSRKNGYSDTSPKPRWCSISRIYTTAPVSIYNTRKKKLAVCVIIFCFALFAIIASASQERSESGLGRADSDYSVSGDDDARDDIQTEEIMGKTTKSTLWPATISSKDPVTLDTSSTSKLMDDGNISIVSKSDASAISQFNQSSLQLDTHELEDDFVASKAKPHAPLLNPTQVPSYYSPGIKETERPVLFHTTLFDNLSSVQEHSMVPTWVTLAPSHVKRNTEEPLL